MRSKHSVLMRLSCSLDARKMLALTPGVLMGPVSLNRIKSPYIPSFVSPLFCVVASSSGKSHVYKKVHVEYNSPSPHFYSLFVLYSFFQPVRDTVAACCWSSGAYIAIRIRYWRIYQWTVIFRIIHSLLLPPILLASRL